MRREGHLIGAVVVTGVLVSSVILGMTSGAFAATPTATATGVATPAASKAPTATPSAAVTSAADPAAAAPKVAPSPAASAPAATTGAAAAPSATATGTDPALSTQNALRDHAMGSTVAAHEPASTSPLHSLLATPQTTSTSYIYGLDVSAYQGNVNWTTQKKNGASFAYIKATEGTGYKSAYFASQYSGAAAAGLIRGAYAFANPTPSTNTAVAQANFFVANGGGWTADGKTLPPLLDIEYGSSSACWGVSTTAMVAWIKAFSSTVQSLTGRAPAIYSTADWWNACTHGSTAFGATNPLFIAHYDRPLASGPGTLPAGWSSWKLWQYADSGVFAGDQDVANGTAADLKGLALPSALESPKGTIDDMHAAPGGVSLRGWAFDPDSTSSIRVHVYVDSKGYSLAADEARPDVQAAYPTAPLDSGLAATVAAAPGIHKVCAYAMNVGPGSTTTLACRSIRVLASNPIGAVNVAKAGTTSIAISGWAIDGDVTTSIPVAVYVDSKGTQVIATGNRADVGSVYPAYGAAHGFSVTMTATQGSHRVCAYGINKNSPGANALLGCKTVVVTDHPPRGNLDTVAASTGSVTIRGWAEDTDAPTTSIRVALYVDSAGTQAVANVSRPDVANALAGGGALHGFNTTLSANAGSHRVCAYALDSDGLSHPLLGCKTVTVK